MKERMTLRGIIDRHPVFRLPIRGDSMEGEYPDGCILELRGIRPGDALEIGQDYVIQRTDGKGTFKRLAKIRPDALVFKAVNRKKFPAPIVVPRKHVMCMAKAVGILIPKGR